MSPPASMMLPLRRCARPTISSSKVLLPTPLRPTIATVSPVATSRLRSSTTSVGPQPPPSLRVSSIGRAFVESLPAGRPEVHRLHLRIGHHDFRLAGHQHRAVHQDGNLRGKTPHHLH